MDNLEYRLMQKADLKGAGTTACIISGHANQLNTNFLDGLFSFVRTMDCELKLFSDFYKKLDTSKYDLRHGGSVLRKIKYKVLPKLQDVYGKLKQEIDVIDQEGFAGHRTNLINYLNKFRESATMLRDLCGQFADNPKYCEYRTERQVRFDREHKKRAHKPTY